MSLLFRAYYAAHFRLPPFGMWSQANHDTVLASLPARASASLLDVGSGDGPLARVIAERQPGWQVLGVDIDGHQIQEARRKGGPANLRFEHLDFYQVQGRYDIITSCGCWEFFELHSSIQRVLELLEPGGTLVVNSLAPGLFGRLHAGWYTVAYRRRMELKHPRALAAALEAAGLHVRWQRVNRGENSYTLVATRP